ncbi:MAG: hypothetical protein AAF633_21985, partial [Chloroflexota bacterium]
QKAIDTARREVARWEKAERENQTSIAQKAGQLAQLEERLKEAEGQNRSGLSTEITQLKGEEEKRLSASSSAAERVKSFREERQTLRNREIDLEKMIKGQRRRLDEARRALNKATTTIARQQAKVEMLMESRQSEISIGDQDEIIGRLAQFISIERAYEKTIGLVLAERLNTLIVGDQTTFWNLFSKRKPNQSLSLYIKNGNSTPDSAPLPDGFPADKFRNGQSVITAKSEAQALANALLGQVLIADENDLCLEYAQALPAGWTIVSRDGLLAQKGGFFEIARQDAANSALTQENALREAEKQLGDEEDRFGELDETLATEQKTLRELNQELDEISRERRRLGGLLSEAEQQANRAQRDADKLTQRRSFLEQQISNQEKDQNRLIERQQTLVKALAQEEAHSPDIKTKLEAARAALTTLPIGEVNQQRNTLRQQIAGNRSILDGRRAIADSRRATLNQVDKQIARLDERRKGWSRQLMEMNLDASMQHLDKLERDQKSLLAEINPLREKFQALLKSRRLKESEMAPQQKIVHTLETQFTQSKIALTQKETQIDNLKERIKSELGIVQLSYDDDQVGDTPLPLGTDVVEELPQPEEIPEKLDDQIQKMRSQLSRMGAVNPEAPAEYESVSERHDFLETQIVDLNQTEGHLREVIDELDELTSKAFGETVIKVNEVFGKMFTRLFGGGSADLSLTDPDDLTVSGVDITAQLPGRRPQGLALLSGGERSLTAASLIFALLKVSPTPFCVMDEVDAALDEANVNRFRDVLHELSIDTQFIVITHNRGTVQAARTIYGITMGTDSTSQAISIKPEEYLTQPKLINSN